MIVLTEKVNSFLRNMAKTIKVYSTPTCPYCKMVKSYLDDKNIEYVDVDVSVDEKAADEMIQKSGQMGVPVLDIDGEMIVGFDQDKIAKALE